MDGYVIITVCLHKTPVTLHLKQRSSHGQMSPWTLYSLKDHLQTNNTRLFHKKPKTEDVVLVRVPFSKKQHNLNLFMGVPKPFSSHKCPCNLLAENALVKRSGKRSKTNDGD